MPTKTQRCPLCKQQLTKEAYPPSSWNKKGSLCRTCSNVRSRVWRKNNPEKVRENNKRRRRLFPRYGIAIEDFDRMLLRQRERCLGCRKPFALRRDIHVDHDHETGLVRGLLCRGCNTGLGSLNEDVETLRRLMVYLRRDPALVSVYLIGSLRNDKIVGVGNILREVGFDVVDDWVGAGPEADDYWQQYERDRGRTYVEALAGRAAQNTFLFDKAHLDLADAVVLILPAGKSSHLELGYAAGNGTPSFVLLNGEYEQERYEVMPNMATQVCTNIDELLLALEVVREGCLDAN